MAKFRSWNKWNQKFEYFKDGMYFRDEKCKDYYDSHEVNKFNWQNAEQATGLFDKNGKEIYEGDKLSDGKGIGIVWYFENVAMFLITEENRNAYYLNEGDITRPCNLQYSKIIGNIHEGEKTK